MVPMADDTSTPSGGVRPGAAPRHVVRQPAHVYRRRRAVAAVAVVAVLGAGASAASALWSTLVSDGSAGPTPAGGADSPGHAEPEAEEPPSGFAIPGLLTFRGSPSRSYYGEGPVPRNPEVLWSHPPGGGVMCHTSTREGRQWCGTGWTGQPAVFERDGRTWVVFGAFDRNVHFLDWHTGEQLLPPYQLADIVKGSVSIDPDGYPLLYVGGALADTKLHVVALDRPQPEQLWALDAYDVAPTMWWDNWDGSALVMDDFLFQGGENSNFHVVKLNRSYDEAGNVQVAPELVFHAPGWDDQLLADLRGSARAATNVSIESSVAYHEGVVYFSNGGGLVQGWDVSGVADGVDPTRVFRFWAGDDTDATITIDDDGYLYVAVEWEHMLPRGREVGQVLKLDPRRPEDPVVWSFHDPAAGGSAKAGLWATLGLHRDIVIAPTNAGRIFALDRRTGEVRWEVARGAQTWSSPVIVDDVWVQASCDEEVRAYDVSNTRIEPPELWSVQLEGCVESTPAVWEGRVFVGSRGGRFYAIGDAPRPSPTTTADT
jgi:outer membrane protein assembly factor BamB